MKILVRPLPRALAVDHDRIAHRTNGAMTGCYQSVAGQMTVTLLACVRRMADDAVPADTRLRWCVGCFPPGRCEVCRVPVDNHPECLDCLRDGIDVDKWLSRAQP